MYVALAAFPVKPMQVHRKTPIVPTVVGSSA
jgi:hypothetical protein